MWKPGAKADVPAPVILPDAIIGLFAGALVLAPGYLAA